MLVILVNVKHEANTACARSLILLIILLEVNNMELKHSFNELTENEMLAIDGGAWSWGKFAASCAVGAGGGFVGTGCNPLGAAGGAIAGGIGYCVFRW